MDFKKIWNNKSFSNINITCCKSITVVQIGTYYVDATLSISLFLIITELIAINTKKDDLFENYLILAMSIGMCSNAKFTGLGYAGVFCAAFYIYGVIKNRKDKKYIVRKYNFLYNYSNNNCMRFRWDIILKEYNKKWTSFLSIIWRRAC